MGHNDSAFEVLVTSEFTRQLSYYLRSQNIALVPALWSFVEKYRVVLRFTPPTLRQKKASSVVSYLLT